MRLLNLLLMLKNFFMKKQKILSTEPYILYQNFIDDIFGKDEVKIKPAESNPIIGTFKFIDEFQEFKKNFKNRLLRLKSCFEFSSQYKELKNQVALIADKNNWEGAYAELAVYDIFSKVESLIELNKTLPVDESYAKELGHQETNEDGYIPHFNLYFDVKILSDVIGTVLKKIISDAIKDSIQEYPCSVLPEYPLDDNEEKYINSHRKEIYNELRDFLKNHNSLKNGHKVFQSKVVEHLSYNIQWGGGINSSISCYSPYKHAFEDRNIIFKRYTKKFLKNNPFILVMVNFPWYNGKINNFADCDQLYYRSLSRRTFCEYLKDTKQMKDIISNFNGSDTVFEVSRHLTGIIFIDDNIIKENSYLCSAYLNPNAINKNSRITDFIQMIVNGGDKRSLSDDFEYDNY